MNRIEVTNLGKKLCMQMKRGILYGLSDVARAMLGMEHRDPRKMRQGEFWAVSDINFKVESGKTLGIIGNNGSGKSTLLRLVNGIFLPDLGSVKLRGRVAPLIGVGSGFHPHMTGKENTYLNGTILGMSRKEIAEKMEQIISFAGIGESINAPVNTYSSGMRVRLGFSIAIHSDLQILLADEILSVSDQAFREKCFQKISELRRRGVTTLLVSHNMHTISLYCDEVLVMDKAQQKFIGPPHEAIAFYNENYCVEVNDLSGIQKRVTGNEQVTIKKVVFSPSAEAGYIKLPTGSQAVKLLLECDSKENIDELYFEASLKAPGFGIETLGNVNNQSLQVPLALKRGLNTLEFEIPNLPIHGGSIVLDIELMDKFRTKIFSWTGIPIVLSSDSRFLKGWMKFDAHLKITQ